VRPSLDALNRGLDTLAAQSGWGAGGDPAQALGVVQGLQSTLQQGLDRASQIMDQMVTRAERLIRAASQNPDMASGHSDPDFSKSAANITAASLQGQLSSRAGAMSSKHTTALLRMLG
jgi:hypothetical protein